MGDSKLGYWNAVAIKQTLDTLDQKQLVLYTGFGRKSNPDDFNPFKKQGIFILNAEFYHHFSKSFQYSLAASYRLQNEYAGTSPYAALTPSYRQEYRLYGRFSHLFEWQRIKLVNTFRAESRFFLQPDFAWWTEDFQLRLRYRLQFSYAFGKNQTNRFVISAEPLFANSHQHALTTWGGFSYRESRFCFFWGHTFKNAPFTVHIGYMLNQLTDKFVSYGSVDLIWNNPFKKGALSNFRSSEGDALQ